MQSLDDLPEKYFGADVMHLLSLKVQLFGGLDFRFLLGVDLSVTALGFNHLVSTTVLLPYADFGLLISKTLHEVRINIYDSNEIF